MTRTFPLDAPPLASNGRALSPAANPATAASRPAAVAPNFTLERAANGTPPLQTGTGSREPAPVELPACRRPKCTRPATTTGDCLAHRIQIAYDHDPEWEGQ